MIRRVLHMSRSLAIGMAVAVLTLALSSPPAAIADDRLNFTGTTLSGAPFDGAVAAGQARRAVVLDAVVPVLQRRGALRQQVAAANPNVTFVGVAARSDVSAMDGFVSKYNLNFTNLNDADGSIWARYDVPWQPAYVFYRADGTSTFVNNPTSAMPQQELPTGWRRSARSAASEWIKTWSGWRSPPDWWPR